MAEPTEDQLVIAFSLKYLNWIHQLEILAKRRLKQTEIGELRQFMLKLGIED